MKMRSAVLIGVGVIALVITIGVALDSNKQTSENTIRVAFFPNIGHAIPIVGLDKGIFEDNLGNATNIEQVNGVYLRPFISSNPHIIFMF